VSTSAASGCFLFDNGSLRPDATHSLRKVAAALAAHTGKTVHAVSLLHSSNVPAEALNGEPARLLEPALLEFFSKNPEGEALILPFFFGPSAALTTYVPDRMNAVRARFPRARIRLAPWLVDIADADRSVASMLADKVRDVMRQRGWRQPGVILVDHGSPQPEVTAVRDHLGKQLRGELGREISALAAASMERREGAAYAFGDPLLATALRTAPFNRGEVVVALQFLSPGRHAGPGGDIAGICAAAQPERSGPAVAMTEPLASDDPRLVELLARRLDQARNF
jgi:sirohydrochlorin ferrochelatase